LNTITTPGLCWNDTKTNWDYRWDNVLSLNGAINYFGPYATSAGWLGCYSIATQTLWAMIPAA